MADVEENPVYKQHRIHTQHLPSGLWLASIVNVGKRKMTSTDSLTATVSRIPHEFDSEPEALQAARRYIDLQEAMREPTSS